jgi:DMSO/TMAO reductase YedYZ molybdopterin-dependent catalytic subunit
MASIELSSLIRTKHVSFGRMGRTVLLGWIWYSASALAQDEGLTVRAPGHDPVHLEPASLASLGPHEILVQDEKGQDARYRGVPLRDVLAKAGAALPTLRGKKALTGTVRVNAADGYAVVFALPELDPDFTDREVLVCFERDGKPLSGEEGPLRLVVPGEKKHARWVRRVVELVVQPGIDHEN